MKKMQCQTCHKTYVITNQDEEFFNKIKMPLPRQCPDCRQQKRLAWRNERFLYERKCDLCNKQMISLYPSDSKYKVYCKDCWWSDMWDPMSFGINYDNTRSFFAQFSQLIEQVPRLGFIVSHGENSDYSTYTVYFKNSFLCISGVVGENILYSYWLNDSSECCDCATSYKLEKCYDCVDCNSLYECMFCKDCEDSSSLAFCQACIGCNNCIACKNLRHKDFHIFNKSVSQAEYEKYLEKILINRASLNACNKKVDKFFKKLPNIYSVIKHSDDCTGNYILNSKNSRNCYDVINLENCSYCWNIPQGAKDVFDINYSPRTELCYNSMSVVNGNNIFNCWNSWDDQFCEYCADCFYSQNLFGCIGLRHQENCILNKKYSEADYQKLKEQILEEMKEYGEFFPGSISPFAYNETIAQDFFPLKKEQAQMGGWQWKEQIKGSVHDSVIRQKNTKKCTGCGKIFKYIPQELDFYKEMGLPRPNKCFSCRHLDRLKLRNPNKLWHRQCMCTQTDHGHQGRCTNEFETSYSPDGKELVYCEQCYNQEIY